MYLTILLTADLSVLFLFVVGLLFELTLLILM